MEEQQQRPTGPPLGAATQSTGRPMGDNAISRTAPLNTIRRNPPYGNGIRHAASSSSLSAGAPISAGQVVALAREAMRAALYENETKAAEASGVSNELKPGITIDLSHKQIQRFPEEVVDIIKHELERLALSHNQISTFPVRFSECTSLRYLNVRNNVIREFPSCICKLTSLEILDLKGNKLKTLPPELVKLTSLKVLSVEKNRIEALPLCLADMTSLQVIKLTGNPVRFPPPEILEPPATSPPNAPESETDTAVTSQIKKYLRQRAVSDRSETESGGEESSEGTETPRPMKRVMSGRFPIKVNGVDLPNLRSPALPQPPPIPSRSHYRGLSQQNAALRRPGVMPLTIGSTNERVRSNSENTLQNSRISTDRSRRMGIIPKKPSELGTVDETKSNRFSHYRGLSHGSAISGGVNGSNGNTKSPASPADSAMPRPTYVRRLSSLPERKRASNSPDVVIEGAKGVLYALFEMHPLIQSLLSLAGDGTNKRTSLERVFYNATTQVEELDRDLTAYYGYSEEEEEEESTPRSNENVHRACLAAVGAYIHVCSLLTRNVDTLIKNGDPRYIRTLLLHTYGALTEIRNAGADLFTESQMRTSRIPEESEGTIRSQPRDKSATPTRDRPGIAPRLRSATVVQHQSNLRVATDAAPPPFLNSANRLANMSAATPRSGDSFASSSTSAGRMTNGDFTDEDRVFENIFLHLQQTTEMSMRTLPTVNSYFISAMRTSNQQSTPDQPKLFWQTLIQRTTIALDTTEALKSRLSTIKLKEPGIRTQGAFWELCNAFIETYTQLATRVKDAKTSTSLLPANVIILFRPLQKSVKNCGRLIDASPWSYLATPRNSNAMLNGSYSVKSPASQVPLPMTPQSAALGPAVQATVPSTPQSATYNSMFSGNVFERADAFLAMNGSSAASSRTGTMTSNDGTMMPNSMLSPMNSMNSRFNGNGSRMAF